MVMEYLSVGPLIGVVKDISSMTTRIKYEYNRRTESYKTIVEINTRVVFETEQGTIEIIFRGCLPSHLIGKRVSYAGYIQSGTFGLNIDQAFLLGEQRFSACYCDSRETRPLDKHEAKSLVLPYPGRLE